jgi:hypothetical protein
MFSCVTVGPFAVKLNIQSWIIFSWIILPYQIFHALEVKLSQNLDYNYVQYT